mmetsp:Transcript_24245/g.76226  ORF Transcript_24245/g.76226 Transcript_24245/m.76226 type:complete len:379 (-) Transcript_24245:182-1318(-)
MIYVFGFAKDVCALPGKACLALAEGCGRVEEMFTGPLKGALDGVARLCTEAGNFFASFVDRPLSSYVIIKAVLSVASLRACLNAMLDSSLASCEASGSVGIRLWLYVQFGFACLNLIFAPYFQSQVWKLLLEESVRLEADARGNVQIPGAKVHESFRFVLLHDAPVCLYVVALLLSFAWSCMGVGLVAHHGCNPGGWPAQACTWNSYFFWLALIYTASYYYCGCCVSSVVLNRPAAPALVEPLANDIPVATAPPLEGFPATPPIDSQPACSADPVPPALRGVSLPSATRRPNPGLGRQQRTGVKTPLPCLCACFLPPVGVFLRFGCSKQLVICVALTCCGYAPGLIYACVVLACGERSTAQARDRDDLEGQPYYIVIE